MTAIKTYAHWKAYVDRKIEVARERKFRFALRIKTIGRSDAYTARKSIKMFDKRVKARLAAGESLADIEEEYGVALRAHYDYAMKHLHGEYITNFGDIMHVRNLLKLSKKPVVAIEGHPHGGRARDRIIALNTIAEIAETLELQPYSVSTGPREDKRGWDGSKEHHFLMDLTTPIREDRVGRENLITFVDVDYYIPLSTFERYAGNKMVIFTVEIDAVGGSDRESMWSVTGDLFTENIAGGVTWQHQVWSYSGATCIIRDDNRNHGMAGPGDKLESVDGVLQRKPCGFWMYHVERLRFPGTNKMLVFLNPQYYCRYPWELSCIRFGTSELEAQQLFRINAVTTHSTKMGDFRIAKFGGPHPYVSLSYMKPTRHVVKIPAEVWEGLNARRRGVNSFGSAVVEAHLKAVGCKQSTASVLLITAALTEVPEHINFVGYTADTEYLNDVENVARLTAPPMLPPAAASGQSTADMEKSIKTLVDVRNNTVPSPEIRAFAKEFSDETAKRTRWVFLGHDETIEIMLKSNPNRKAEIEAFVANPKNTDESVLAQIKADAVAGAAEKGKNARLILPQATYELYRATRCVRPWCDEAHKDGPERCGHFYVCGNTPDQIADKVVGAVRAAEANGNILTGTDFSKFDLHNSEFTRKCYMESNARSCQNTGGANIVRKILSSEMNKTIVPRVKSKRNAAPNKRLPKIDSGTMNLSGAADTTSLNTHTNALVSYITMRRMGRSHLDAYDNIRPKYGDDGLEEHVEEWLETIKLLGFGGTIDPRASNADPIDFLSRVFVKPLETNTSICEPVRAIRKLPTTCSTRPLEKARYDKANGYNTTDGQTPLVGEYARAILRVYGDHSGSRTARGAEERELEYKLRRGPYPFSSDYECAAKMVVANRMGMDVQQVEQLAASYDAAQTPEDMEALATTTPSSVAEGCRPLR